MARRALSEPVLVEMVHECLDETDCVGKGVKVNVVRHIGRPVIVSGLFEPGA
jgi:hypothetical protein